MATISKQCQALLDRGFMWDMIWPVDASIGNDIRHLADFRAAGVNFISLTVGNDDDTSARALARVAQARAFLRENSDTYAFVTSVQGIRAARRDGKMAVGLHFGGTRCLERNLDLVETFYALGVRHNLLVFNYTNSTGGGCAEIPDRGLTKYGEAMVREMNRVGMLLDLSHTGVQTSLDAMAISTKPVMFSHSNAQRVHNHYRNLTDEQIRACAATGGVVGMSASSGYLGVAQSSAAAICNHIDYVVGLVGDDHVGLGLDIVFEYEKLNAYIKTRPDQWPEALKPNWPGFNYLRPANIPEIADELLRRGYSEDSVLKIMGGNFMRICEQVWQ